MPRSNGYLLFSALSRLCFERAGLDLFHGASGRKDFSLSPLLPSDFWWTGRWAALPVDFSLAAGTGWAFRVCFFDERAFEAFANAAAGAYLSLNGAGFEVSTISLPGDNPMSASAGFRDLFDAEPADGVELTYATPCGFLSRTDGTQRLMPVPEVLFPSLAMRFRDAAGEVFDKVDASGIAVRSFNLQSSAARLKHGSSARGCVGCAVYEWRGADEQRRRVLSCLARFAFFAGAGYKTSQGLGQVFPLFEGIERPV